VDGSADTATGRFTLAFSSGAAAGAAFLVTSGNRTDGPWTYTTEAGKAVSDTWNSAYSGGSHDLTVHGPNGFLRAFRNAGRTAGPEAVARYAGDDVELTFTNKGASTAALKVADGYGGQVTAVRVAPGATVRRRFSLAASGRWYDLTVTSDTDGGFLRRFAGHVENGRPGVSDPAIATR
jgi:phospholipase C